MNTIPHNECYCRDEDLDAIEVAVQRTQRRRKAHEQRIKAAFAALPQDDMPAATQQRIKCELDAILADLRSGKLDTLVTFTPEDHNQLEAEHIGAYLIQQEV